MGNGLRGSPRIRITMCSVEEKKNIAATSISGCLHYIISSLLAKRRPPDPEKSGS